MNSKYEKFFKSNEFNIFNLAKNKRKKKNEFSFNQYMSNQNVNKSKSKNNESNKNNFKSTNLLQQNIKEPILIKNNKNEINIRLNLNCALINNINNINKYNNVFNNQIITNNNFLTNSTSLDNLIKEKENNSKKELYKKYKKLNDKKNQYKKNLSQINFTNIANNKYKINITSLSKAKSTENITKNFFNRRCNSERIINNLFNKNNYLCEKNLNSKSNTKRYSSQKIIYGIQPKRINSYNKSLKKKYNNYNNINIKNNNIKNRWIKNYNYKNICKNSEYILNEFKRNKTFRIQNSKNKNYTNIFSSNQKKKKEDFDILKLDEIYNKTKNILEKCKYYFEIQIKNKG